MADGTTDDDFMPIVPSSLNAEEAVQIQPQVTIQRTVSTGVYAEVSSYE